MLENGNGSREHEHERAQRDELILAALTRIERLLERVLEDQGARITGLDVRVAALEATPPMPAPRRGPRRRRRLLG